MRAICNWGEPQLLNKLDVDEVELVLPVLSVKSRTTELSNELSIELPEGLSIRLSKELSKGLSETAATIYKLKSLRFIDRDGSTGHGNWKVIE